MRLATPSWILRACRLRDATPGAPVLVLRGEHGTFVGIDNSQRLADALSNSEFHVIADAGHYSWEDNPEPYLAHFLDWIERAEAAIDT